LRWLILRTSAKKPKILYLSPIFLRYGQTDCHGGAKRCKFCNFSLQTHRKLSKQGDVLNFKMEGFLACYLGHLTTQYVAYNHWMTVNNELERNTKQASVVYFNALYSDFPVGANKTTKALIIVCPDRESIQIPNL
jgi:hypothetical protein